MPRDIDFHFDILSPFAHVALARLGELPEGTVVRPKPVLLGGLLTHFGQRGPAEIAPKRLHTYRLATFLGEKYGRRVIFPPRHPFNPLGALRMVGRAFDFVFGQGRAAETPDELAGFAEAVGAPLALATDDAAKAKLRANTDAAIALGVFGVPSFTVATPDGHEVFWGVDGFDMLKAWLAEDGTMFARKPYRHIEDVEIGISRK
jgi:2-hydroxychromene-2-carboxylate isomerase